MARAQTPPLFGPPTVRVAPLPADDTVSASILSGAPAVQAAPARERSSPTRRLTITNASSAPIRSLEVSVEGKRSRLLAELAAGATTTVALTRSSSCEVAIVVVWGDPERAETYPRNICRVRTIRLTE